MSEAVDTVEATDELEAQLPMPVGYRVLIALPQDRDLESNLWFP